jgi:uncharacterized protein (DUF302 family)
MMPSTRPAPFGFGATLAGPLAEAIERTKEALKGEGFGVLTTIDVRDTMQQKLGVGIEPYVILGACNPQLAYRGLQAEPELGLLLPCNVTLRERPEGVEVMAIDPELMLGVIGANPELEAVATEAAARLQRVVAALNSEPSSR